MSPSIGVSIDVRFATTETSTPNPYQGSGRILRERRKSLKLTTSQAASILCMTDLELTRVETEARMFVLPTSYEDAVVEWRNWSRA